MSTSSISETNAYTETNTNNEYDNKLYKFVAILWRRGFIVQEGKTLLLLPIRVLMNKSAMLWALPGIARIL